MRFKLSDMQPDAKGNGPHAATLGAARAALVGAYWLSGWAGGRLARVAGTGRDHG